MNKRNGAILAIALLLTTIIAVVLVQAIRSKTVDHLGLPQDELCTLPCWYSIVPGDSSELDALKALIQHGLIDDSSSYVKDDWLHLYLRSGEEVSIFFEDGEVRQIDVLPTTPIPLSYIVDEMGMPDKVSMNVEGQHEICHVSSILYPGKGMRVKSGKCQDIDQSYSFTEGNVLPDTPVLTISFVEVATDTEGLLRSLRENSNTTLHKWDNYGYYPP